MESVLEIYARPYDPKHPVLCFDERPCFLIGDVLIPVPTEPGKVAKEDYMYEKNGSCCVLLAVEPLTGRRFVKVHERRTAAEYAAFLRHVEQNYPDAESISVVQDNLNTHHGGSFYKSYEPEEAHRLVRRLHMIYTPKHASWLNMAEIEFSVMSRQCLDRRIPTMEQLRDEVEAWISERDRLGVKLNWQFSVVTARSRFKRHYDNLKTY